MECRSRWLKTGSMADYPPGWSKNDLDLGWMSFPFEGYLVIGEIWGKLSHFTSLN